jgi:hypothetical protein
MISIMMIKASQFCQIVVPEQSGKMKLSESYITESLSVTPSWKDEIPLARSVPDSELPSSMVVVQNNFAAKKDVDSEAIQRKRQLSVSTQSTVDFKPLMKQATEVWTV